jgi:membrane-associated phospholipid phosphatase
LALWITQRRDAARRAMFALTCTFFACYLVFILFPVAGPRYLFDLPHNAASNVGPARLVQWVLDHGDAWGAAFPSSHVAAAVVATGMAYLSWRPLGLVLLPLTAGLVLSVVYGQFHYGVDALTGLIVAAVVLAAVGLREPLTAEDGRRRSRTVEGVVLDGSPLDRP